MPSTEWKLKTQHDKWYAGETISVGIGQGAIEVTPLQLARALSGIASGGVLRRPHLVFPNELTPDELNAMHDSYPGSGEKTIPLTPENWEIDHGRHGQRDAEPDWHGGGGAAGGRGLCREDRHGAGGESHGTQDWRTGTTRFRMRGLWG